jgi:2',3'-cyclic-nucleotide 2'-phosphodiesterase (5'-nucleotidase family)
VSYIQKIFHDYLGKPEKVGFIKEAPFPPTTLIEENPHANFVCDAMKHITNSEISVWNNCGIRNFFHEGEIDSSDIKDIAPFFDRISVANISEDKIVNMFKTTIKATYDNPTSYKPGLTAVSGLRYGVNPEKGELTFLTYIDREGKEHAIDINNPRKDKTYKLVTDEFIMSHGADYPILASAEECLEIYPYDSDIADPSSVVSNGLFFEARSLIFFYDADCGNRITKNVVRAWINTLDRYCFSGPIFLAPYSQRHRMVFPEAESFANIISDLRNE